KATKSLSSTKKSLCDPFVSWCLCGEAFNSGEIHQIDILDKWRSRSAAAMGRLSDGIQDWTIEEASWQEPSRDPSSRRPGVWQAQRTHPWHTFVGDERRPIASRDQSRVPQ